MRIEPLFVARHQSIRAIERRSEEHTSELQSQSNLVCRLLLEKKHTYTSTGNTAPRESQRSQSTTTDYSMGMAPLKAFPPTMAESSIYPLISSDYSMVLQSQVS